MKSFRQFLTESEKISNLTYLQVCHLTIQNNSFIQVPDNYELKRVTKEEALKLTDRVIFVKYFNEELADVFW